MNLIKSYRNQIMKGNRKIYFVDRSFINIGKYKNYEE